MVNIIINHCDDTLFKTAKIILLHKGFDNCQPEYFNRDKGTISMAGTDEALRAIDVLSKYNITAELTNENA
jgi:hypothetical protein